MILKRPLVFLDLETTTNIVKDARIVQFSMKKFFPSGETASICNYVNPVVPISETAINVHGITNEKVASCPTFTHYGPEIHSFILGCDLVGYNSNSFDIPIMYNEFHRAGIDWDYSGVHFIDACNIFKINEPRDLSHAYKHYTGKTLFESHDANQDVKATIDVFVHQMDKYTLPWDMEQLALYCNYGQKRADLTGKFIVDGNGDYIVNFGGKCKGQKAVDNKGYMEWMLSQDFPEDAKRICRKILNPELV